MKIVIITLMALSIGCVSKPQDINPEDLAEYQEYLDYQYQQQYQKIKTKQMQKQLKEITEMANELGEI